MEKSERLSRRAICLGGAGLALLPALSARAAPSLPDIPQSYDMDGPFNLKGAFVQGGFAIGKAAPRTEIIVDGVSRGLTSSRGRFVIGFDRDAPPRTQLEIKGSGSTQLDISPTAFDVQRIDGLPPSLVTPTDPDLLKRIARERAIKDAGFASREDADWFKGGFDWPLRDFRVSGTFGNQRILNGEPKSPHYGFDMAAPTGTLVYAPQTARVVLAEPDLHFEGGLILLDHGQGLISMYLHLSALFVKTGDIVYQGERMGRVGAKGRATGPHLCWRLKWRDRALDPTLMTRL